MTQSTDDKILHFARLLLLAVGSALLLVGFIGIVYDYAEDLMIQAGNSGWMLMTAGIMIMLVAIVFYIIPKLGEHYRKIQLNKYYRTKYPDNADMEILIHEIREQLQIMEARIEILDEFIDSVKAKHGDVNINNIDAVTKELQKQKGSYEKLNALVSKLRSYIDKQTQKRYDIRE